MTKKMVRVARGPVLAQFFQKRTVPDFSGPLPVLPSLSSTTISYQMLPTTRLGI